MAQVHPLVKTLLGYAIPVLIVAGFIGILAWMGSTQTDPNAGTLTQAVTSDDWMKGTADGKMVIVEYSDFQCPTCAAFDPVMRNIIDEFGDQITFVYRHFPLQEIHKNATLAASAAEAAGLQGKFWEMHDELFDTQDSWAKSTDALTIFTTYAQDIGLNVDQFLNDLSSTAVQNAIEEDYDSGLASGVGGTPTFYINGAQLGDLPRGYEPFKAIIEAKLLELGVSTTEPTDSTEASNQDVTSSDTSNATEPATE